MMKTWDRQLNDLRADENWVGFRLGFRENPALGNHGGLKTPMRCG
jgi:hypothetical protein